VIPPYVHLIAGPTGSGKSAAANELTRISGAPVVVADRLQCFAEMATTSARAGAEEDGVQRHWLAERSVADGDYPAAEAAEALIAKVAELGELHPFLIVEGGSVSLLRHLSARLPALPWELTVRLLPIPDRARYLADLTRRAYMMLAPPGPNRSLLAELAELWREPRHRYLAASVNGFEAVLEYCAKYSLDAGNLDKEALSVERLWDIASLIAERHAEHGELQARVFAGLFQHQLSGHTERELVR
jgi:tRNA A37 N6-isopentenylltransferase MiaA